MPPEAVLLDDATLLRNFEDGTLSAFHHRDHVRLAWLYLKTEPPLTALARFAEGLKRFAAAQGHDPLFVSLSVTQTRSLRGAEVPHFHSRQFRHPAAGGIQQRQQRPVAVMHQPGAYEEPGVAHHQRALAVEHVDAGQPAETAVVGGDFDAAEKAQRFVPHLCR